MLLIRRHDSEKFEMLRGPESDFTETQKEFREALASERTHPEIAEIRIYTAEPYRKIRFKTPDAAKAEADKRAADDAAMKKADEERSKPQAKAKTAKAAKPTTKPDAAKAEGHPETPNSDSKDWE